MNTKLNYSYCNTTDCIHRRACKRWIGNYTNVMKQDLGVYETKEFVNEKECIPNLDDVECENKYDLFYRFRSSTGEQL